MEIVTECIMVVIFVLLIIACVGIVTGLSYIFCQVCEGREVTIKMEDKKKEAESTNKLKKHKSEGKDTVEKIQIRSNWY